MKSLILLLLFSLPAVAYVDPWLDCAGDVMCRKVRAGQERVYQQWAVEEQELKQIRMEKGKSQ
jgi:hypothetical protein